MRCHRSFLGRRLFILFFLCFRCHSVVNFSVVHNERNLTSMTGRAPQKSKKKLRRKRIQKTTNESRFGRKNENDFYANSSFTHSLGFHLIFLHCFCVVSDAVNFSCFAMRNRTKWLGLELSNSFWCCVRSHIRRMKLEFLGDTMQCVAVDVITGMSSRPNEKSTCSISLNKFLAASSFNVSRLSHAHRSTT